MKEAMKENSDTSWAIWALRSRDEILRKARMMGSISETRVRQFNLLKKKPQKVLLRQNGELRQFLTEHNTQEALKREGEVKGDKELFFYLGERMKKILGVSEMTLEDFTLFRDLTYNRRDHSPEEYHILEGYGLFISVHDNQFLTEHGMHLLVTISTLEEGKSMQTAFATHSATPNNQKTKD